MVVADPQTAPSQTCTRTSRVPAAAKVPMTVKDFPDRATEREPVPSPRFTVASQLSAPGSVNEPLTDHSSPTVAVDVEGRTTSESRP